MFDRIKAAKQKEEQETVNGPKLMVIDKRTPEGRKLAKLIDSMDKRKQEQGEAKNLLEHILREHIASYGPNEQKVLSLPMRMIDVSREINNVVQAVCCYERAQTGEKATPYGLEMAESVHALLDHIEETVQLLREKYPEMKERAQ